MTTNPFLPSTSGLSPNAGLLGTPGAIVSTSTTSQTIATGSLSFQTQPQAVYAPGMFVSIVDASDSSNYMTGTVSSYSGTTLVVDITVTGGSGTLTDWNISLSGTPGPIGATGATGATGAAGTSAGPVSGFIKGLVIKNNSGTPATKIDITANSAVLVNSSGVSVRKTSFSATIDLTTGTATSAANGMDGEARGTSAWVYLYLINDGGSNFKGLASLTSPIAGSPTLPSGYTYSTYAGAMYVDSSGNLMYSTQHGKRGAYTVTAATNTAAMPLMDSGAKGSTTVPTWQSVATGAFVPASAGAIIIGLGCHSSHAMAAPNNAYGAYSSTTNAPPVVVDSSGSDVMASATLLLESTNIYWAGAVAASYLYCYGWEDYCVLA